MTSFYVWCHPHFDFLCLFKFFGGNWALCLQNRHSTTWATPPVHFALLSFGDGVLQTLCTGWSPTVILLISASQVARMTGVSHWCPAFYGSCLHLQSWPRLVVGLPLVPRFPFSGSALSFKSCHLSPAHYKGSLKLTSSLNLTTWWVSDSVLQNTALGVIHHHPGTMIFNGPPLSMGKVLRARTLTKFADFISVLFLMQFSQIRLLCF
jgi:hypothetical protein